MNNYACMISQLKSPEIMKMLTRLYGQRDGMLVNQITRYSRLLKRHEELFAYSGNIWMISAPGRTEISGNHTDHNRGKVLAAAVNLDTLAAVSPREDLIVNIHSEGYAPITVDLNDTAIHKEEEGTTAALLRGVAAGMLKDGMKIGGFDAVMTSDVRSGSGLSSSAAVENLFCKVFDDLYNEGNMNPIRRAQISQYAENDYFGKPCGLMDQMASSVGCLVYIDFREDQPEVQEISYDFSEKGYAMVVVNVGSSHDDLTDAYAAIPTEMKQVAAYFGESTLRAVLPENFYDNIASLREHLDTPYRDRAIMRASHFFEENHRVSRQMQALLRDDLQAFLDLVIASGRSSFCSLQNVFATPTGQELSLGLIMSEHMLKDSGAWRVHGGGFAGTTLNFVPLKQLDHFVNKMEEVFGNHSCNILDIRPMGPASIKLGQE